MEAGIATVEADRYRFGRNQCEDFHLLTAEPVLRNCSRENHKPSWRCLLEQSETLAYPFDGVLDILASRSRLDVFGGPGLVSELPQYFVDASVGGT